MYTKKIQLHKKVKMIPVFPNLVMSTDKVSTFATSSIINGSESFYITAKSSYVKDEFYNTGSRNHYKRDATRDAHVEVSVL